MNYKLRNLIALAGIVIFLAAGSSSAQSEALGGGRLDGTWDAAVTIINCETGDPIVSFASIANFAQGGTFTGITSGTPPSARTPEIGVWRHVKGNRYAFRFKAFLFNPQGLATAYQVLTHEVVLSQDNLSYTSAGTVQIFTMNGVQIGSGCSTAIGTRMLLN